MNRVLDITADSWPIAAPFTISRGSKTVAETITCALEEEGIRGWGECVPYSRYGESIERVTAQIEKARSDIEAGIDREELLQVMEPGAARNAIDCALWDLEAKKAGRRAHETVCTMPPVPVATAVTVSLDEPEKMADRARAVANHSLVKIKLGTTDDMARLHAVAGAAPHARFIVDANEGWEASTISRNLLAALEYRVVLVEQPLRSDADDILAEVPHPVPICADESAHTAEELEALVGRYDCVNVKLDKTGGLTAAIKMADKAHALGLSVMVGCMVGTSLSMAPAVLLAQRADYVDLDGPLLLSRDRKYPLSYSGALVSPPSPRLWG